MLLSLYAYTNAYILIYLGELCGKEFVCMKLNLSFLSPQHAHHHFRPPTLIPSFLIFILSFYQPILGEITVVFFALLALGASGEGTNLYFKHWISPVDTTTTTLDGYIQYPAALFLS